ncbi:MAG TPA: PIG-L family deacetylase [Candidatus Saccharimonadales bacterium]|nr:PIG-L family deacetylase [Candidatus Saccharimonadales bacterium]
MDNLTYLAIYFSTRWSLLNQRFSRLLRRSGPVQIYLLLTTSVLVISTVFWAYLGSRVQLHNADQLSDPYMFSDYHTFHAARFPAAHTFLLKWPLFALLGMLGVSASSLALATIGLVLITVVGLMLLLACIERRPQVLATEYLILAAMLLLVPAQPYAGGLLPVNMAMVTTRNIEYLVYIGALLCLLKARRLRSWWFAGGIVLLAVLVASDKLFLGLSLGGAGIVLVAASLLRDWRMVTMAVRWFVGGILAAIGSAGIVACIARVHITGIVAGQSLAPYTAAGGAKDIILGTIYGTTGLFTNLGANPAYDNRVLGSLPHDVLHAVATFSGIVRFVVACVSVAALALLVRYFYGYIRQQTVRDHIHSSLAFQLTVALASSTVVAAGLYIATNHYYAVDARYLGIGLFALVIGVVTLLRGWSPHSHRTLVHFGTAATGLVVLAAFVSYTTAHHQEATYASLESRNESIVQLLNRHGTHTIVGDYWRVLPIKLAAHNALDALPLGNCTLPAAALTSGAWQPDLGRTRFAYLISFERSITGYPACSLPQVTTAYGRPNSIQVIAGSLAKPQEAVLFYDTGAHPSPPPTAAQIPQASLLPVKPAQLANTDCAQPTIMNIVAHEDDDLLFLSPDLLHELRAGDCVRSVFMTAGDSGFNKFYWLSRQLGVEAAYSQMLHIPNVWDQQTLALAGGQYMTLASPRASHQVTLIFLNLPDGGIQGSGFTDSNNESLQKLYAGTLPALHTVDGQSSFSSTQLVDALSALMITYQPAEIHTQASVPSGSYPDHSDHIATGRFAALAATQYDQQHFGGVVAIPVVRYIGYPIHGYDENITGDDQGQKEAAFLAYAQYDGGVCHTVAQCAGMTTYDAYLHRQYQQ